MPSVIVYDQQLIKDLNALERRAVSQTKRALFRTGGAIVGIAKKSMRKRAWTANKKTGKVRKGAGGYYYPFGKGNSAFKTKVSERGKTPFYHGSASAFGVRSSLTRWVDFKTNTVYAGPRGAAGSAPEILEFGGTAKKSIPRYLLAKKQKRRKAIKGKATVRQKIHARPYMSRALKNFYNGTHQEIMQDYESALMRSTLKQ